MGKDGLKHYPLNRYVVNRDGNGNVIEIVTKELISRQVIGDELPKKLQNEQNGDNSSEDDDVELYTCVKLVH